MKIRLATEADLPVLEHLVEAASRELDEKYATPRMDTGIVACLRYGVANGTVVVAEQEDDIVGWCARVAMPGLPDGEAAGVGTWVWEPYRREHVGRDMRRLADEHAKAKGLKYVTGTVAIGNKAALKSVLAEGYQVVGYAVRKELA